MFLQIILQLTEVSLHKTKTNKNTEPTKYYITFYAFNHFCKLGYHTLLQWKTNLLYRLVHKHQLA